MTDPGMKYTEILKVTPAEAEAVAPLAAEFRVQLKAFKGIRSAPDFRAAEEEILEFLEAGFPVYAARERDTYSGYMVCRTEGPCVWVEQLFVREDCRRRGVASALFYEAEKLASSMGEDTVYNFVHPNNEGMIAFLRSRGYTVLNMLEIRKPYGGEKISGKVRVDGETFDY